MAAPVRPGTGTFRPLDRSGRGPALASGQGKEGVGVPGGGAGNYSTRAPASVSRQRVNSIASNSSLS